MYRLSLAGVHEDFASLALAEARAKALDPDVQFRSGASGGAVHHYTTLHHPRQSSFGYDPIGERVGIIAWPGYEHLAD